MSKYKIMQNIITKRYKIQFKILWFWIDLFTEDFYSRESVENYLKSFTRYEEGKKKSNWKEV